MAETTFQLPQNVIQARETASGLAGTADKYAAGEITIGDKLRETLNKLYGENEELVNRFDLDTANFLSAPSRAREKFQNIFNPFEREKLVSQYTRGESIPMLSSSNLIGHRFGRMEDIIGTGTRAYEAAAEAAARKAEQAQTVYQSLMDEYTTLEKLRQEQERIEIARESANKSGSGSTGTGDITTLFENWKKSQGLQGGNKGYASGGTPLSLNQYQGIQKTMYPFGGQGAFSRPTLRNPNTGVVYSYDSTSDFDFISDLGRGFVPTNQ